MQCFFVPPHVTAAFQVAKWMPMAQEHGGMGLTGNSAYVYAEIVFWSRRPGTSYEGSLEVLSRDVGISKAATRKILSELEKRGLIVATGERKNEHGRPSTTWAYVPEAYYQAAIDYREFWTAAIADAVRKGAKLLDMFGNRVDAKTALMRLSADVSEIYDEIDKDFDALWAQTVNQNTEIAARSQYRLLRNEGFGAGEIKDVWKRLQDRLLADGRPPSKMPNFAKWATGAAAGVPAARAALALARAAKAAATPAKAAADEDALAARAEARNDVEAMIEEDYAGAKAIAEEIDALKGREAAPDEEMPPELLEANRRFVEAYLEYREMKRAKSRAAFAGDESTPNADEKAVCRGDPV